MSSLKTKNGYRQVGDEKEMFLILTGITFEDIAMRYFAGEHTKLGFPSKHDIENKDFVEKIEHIEDTIINGKKTSILLVSQENDPKRTTKKITNPVEYILSNDWWFHTEHPKIIFACLYCSRESKTNIPMPLRIEADTFNEILNIITEGFVCNYSCALSYAYEKDGLTHIGPNIFGVNRSQIVRVVHNRKFPDLPPLKKAKDKELLKKFGGPLTDQQFDDDQYVYQRTCNIEYKSSTSTNITDSDGSELSFEPVGVIYDRE
jgi:hypothetical protein